MTTDQIVIIAANGIITLGLFFLIKNYLPSYFNEKGKNLATKEDIGAITDIVESAKLSNNTQLEYIKNELGLVSKAQVAIYDDERKAIVEFLATITDFYESNINIPIVYDTPEGLAYFTEKIRTLGEHYSKLQIAKSKLQLFCHSNEILEASTPILIELTDIQGKTRVKLFEVLGSQKVSALYGEMHAKNPTEDNLRKLKDEIDKQTKMHKDFQDFKVAFHKNYYPKYHKLQELSRVYLSTKKATNC